MAYWLLFFSVVLSSGRNVFSKSISQVPAGSKAFFRLQTVIFGSGMLLLLTVKGALIPVASLTVVLAVIYGLLLVSAQWNYTAAMQKGNVSLCATVYSLGFIFPTLSGAIFWKEGLGLWQVLGILVAVAALVVSGTGKESETRSQRYFLPLIVAMLSSGGLGILQKVQQSTGYGAQKTAFVLIAMAVAAGLSGVRWLVADKAEAVKEKGSMWFAMVVGLCFSIGNLLNTTLAGMLSSATVFPLMNIGSILCSTLVGIFVFREKLTIKSGVVLGLGILAILFIGIS